MKINNRRKIIKSFSVIIAILLIAIMTTTISFATNENNTIKAYNALSKDVFYAYKSNIVSVTFSDIIDEERINSENVKEKWNISAAENGNVMAWIEINEDTTTAAGEDRYDLYISADGEITANTNSSSLFYDFQNLEVINGLEHFDTTGVTRMHKMFFNCTGLKSLDLSTFKTNNVTTMNEMFYNCSSLEYLDVSSFDTSKVTKIAAMFYNCNKLTSLNVENFDLSKVPATTSMFADCSGLTSLKFDNFNMVANKDMSFMFAGCSSLTDLCVNKLNVSNVEYLIGTFQGCSSLKNVELKNLKKVIDMSLLFSECTNLQSVNFEGFSSTALNNTSYLFEKCSSIKELDLSLLNTSNVTTMKSMFFGCNNLTSLNISNFNTEKVKSMFQMFEGCSSLETLDISSFNTSKVTDMAFMFAKCSKLKSIDLNHLNTENVVTMGGLFNQCTSLETVNINKLNTASVNNMHNMFNACYSLKTIDISNFITDKVTLMSFMFGGCKNLETIYVGENWSTEKVTTSQYMFNKCYKLKGNITYDETKIDHTYANTENYLTFKPTEFKYIINVPFKENLIHVGQITPINPTTTPAGNKEPFTFTSSDTNVLTVDENGNMKGISYGTTIVTVSISNGFSKNIQVRVSPNRGTVPVTFESTNTIDVLWVALDGGYVYNKVLPGETFDAYIGSSVYIKINKTYDHYYYTINNKTHEDEKHVLIMFDEPSIIRVTGKNNNESENCTEHIGGIANCQDKAICLLCGKSYGEIDPNNHKNIVIDKAVKSTCAATGLTEGSHCNVCNTIITKQEILPKLEHTKKVILAVPATCTRTGLTEGIFCTTCNETVVKRKETPKLDHTPETVRALKPTCTRPGSTEWTRCSVCKETLTPTTSVPATGHDYDDKGFCKTCGINACPHMCHDNHLLWKIILFFWKLFKINPVCDCGLKHY